MAFFKSPFAHHLHTNYVPVEVERAEIFKFLEEPEHRIAGLKQEMVSLEKALDHVTQDRDRLQSTIQRHRALLSPLRILPNDVLLRIFVFCLPDSHNALMDLNEPPLVLGLVCRRWRHISYNSPRLWASLHIPFPTLSTYPCAPPQGVIDRFKARMSLHQAAIHQWLVRSGSYPLSLSLHPPIINSLDEIRPDDYRAYLILLISVFSRLRALEVTVPSGDFSAFFASITPEELPMLESIRLMFLDNRQQAYLHTDPTLHDEKWRNDGFLRVRSLREVHLVQFPFSTPFFLVHKDIQWYSLTHLDITYSRGFWQDQGFNIWEAHSMLMQCYYLVHLGIEVMDSPDGICPLGLIRLPYLQSITLFDAAYHLSTLIDQLDAPNLKNVQYHTKLAPWDLRPSPLLALLSGNHRGTQKLTTNIEFLTLLELLWCFFYTPHLTHFRHEHRKVSTEQSIYLSAFRALPVDSIRAFLEFLIPDQHGKCSWPNLVHLHVKDVHPQSVYDDVIKRLVEGRRRQGATVLGLKKIRVESEGYNPGVNWEPYTRHTLGSEPQDGHGGGVNVDFIYPTSSRPLRFPGLFSGPVGTFDRGY